MDGCMSANYGVLGTEQHVDDPVVCFLQQDGRPCLRHSTALVVINIAGRDEWNAECVGCLTRPNGVNQRRDG